ncbi:hypothetical protein E1262_13845 [Jiangella aurantiaca]|uniref:Uncharacterized protein n=1 Tax=Jiangella aurantiaca TaxID=2530373 RepID=A0A4R5AGF5_9ACTN|nr:hypothetical protein [Jiangella aurantiaca]TDD69102.1 hypothetical protein E1262_13845 [Jiangella aurantiaca]
MTSTQAFGGIPAGTITWDGLLTGALAVPATFLAALLVFWLQSRHGARQGLVEAVESLRELVMRVASAPAPADGPWVPGGARRLTEDDARLFVELGERIARVRSRCGRRDRALAAGLRDAHLSVIAAVVTGETAEAAAVWRFLDAWLDSRGGVRSGRITIEALRPGRGTAGERVPARS